MFVYPCPGTDWRYNCRSLLQWYHAGSRRYASQRLGCGQVWMPGTLSGSTGLSNGSLYCEQTLHSSLTLDLAIERGYGKIVTMCVIEIKPISCNYNIASPIYWAQQWTYWFLVEYQTCQLRGQCSEWGQDDAQTLLCRSSEGLLIGWTLCLSLGWWLCLHLNTHDRRKSVKR